MANQLTESLLSDIPLGSSSEPVPDPPSPSAPPGFSHDGSEVAVPEDSSPEPMTSRALSVPPASEAHSNTSQAPSVPSNTKRRGEPISPEVGKADVQIAADGSFVQTSSALAARELKKTFDQILRDKLGTHGVIRSPYAITAVQDASGNNVFRIGYRQTSLETSEAADTASESSAAHSPGHTTGTRRRARLSVHDFLVSTMFKANGTPPRNTSALSTAPGSSSSNTSPSFNLRNKLRKQRSNSDLHLRGSSSPPYGGGSNASVDGHAPLSPRLRSDSFAIEIRDEITAGADAFSQVVGWSTELVTDSIAPSRKSSKASTAPPSEELHGSLAPALDVASSSTRRPSVSTSAALSTSVGETKNNPFGENVRYTAPTRRSAILLAPKPAQIREVQSFESGLTARAGDDENSGTPKPKSTPTATTENESEAMLAATSQIRFSTNVFDVLQTYRGLPLPSTLSALSTGATIKLSTTDSPNPKDDPRFVIWGEIQPEGSHVDDTSISYSFDSHTDLSASASSVPSSRKRSNARAPQGSNEASSEVTPKTMIIAATVERWIAQLTSELNYDELLNFLLTYRTYISPVDLCHLLICRFHWALDPPSSWEDDKVRRIVHVRTFIAMRYWLLTFFREDFLPNPELCHLFTSWLNTLSRDQSLKKHADALNTVRKLKKIVRDCKEAHSRHGKAGLGRSDPYPSLDNVGFALDAGTSRKTDAEKPNEQADDEDVDLDFSGEGSAVYADYSLGGTMNSLHQAISSSAGSAMVRSAVPVSGQALSNPSPNSILLSQPLNVAILGHVKSSAPGTEAPLTQSSSSLPVQHSAISRAFVNTIGRLGRWKRVLNSRSSVVAAATPACADVSSFDIELNATGDLLFVHGGVEEYLKMLNLSPPQLPDSPPQNHNLEAASEGAHPARPPGLELVEPGSSSPAMTTLSRPSSLSPSLGALHEENENAGPEDLPDTEARNPEGINFLADLSAGAPSPSDTPSIWIPDVVSLDDISLSDSDLSSHSSTRARRMPRRLPLRRDFQFVRRSVDTVSSMGIRSYSSVASSIRSESISPSAKSPTRESEMSDGHPVMAGIQSWQIELIESDDEGEAGDAEAALRRLEGQIDSDRQREKDLKVGRWLRTAHQRRRDSTASSVHSSSAHEEFEQEAHEEVENTPTENEDITVSIGSMSSSVVESAPAAETAPGAEITSMIPADSSRTVSVAPASTPAPTPAQAPTVASVRNRSGSVESAQVSMTSRPTSRRPSLLGRASRGVPSKFGSPNVPATHRSFILMHRSETLAQQFAIVEAELFTKIKFEELICHRWGQNIDDVNIRDWAQFAKERAKLRNTASPTPDRAVKAKLSAILALRARFDLLVNFTASEVLLTHPSERVMVVEKFIRIAWKAYLHNNFSTLVALVAGLQTRWVNQVMARRWNRVGMWEQRLFDDLRKFTTRTGNFKYLRTATAAIVDAQPLGPSAQEGVSTKQTGPPSRSKTAEVRNRPACIPFLGMYLAQLYDYERLPDFIDPTAPGEPVLIDPENGNLSSPSHPEFFSNLQTLPLGVVLEPLINVHKQRLIAGVIKSFVAGQHLATNVHFEVDHQKSWQKCFRLRSLEADALHGLARSQPDS